METSKQIKPISGFLMLFLLFAAIGGIIVTAVFEIMPATIILSLFAFFGMLGFMVVSPNQARVLTFFGKYSGTVITNGFFWVNPFYTKRKIT